MAKFKIWTNVPEGSAFIYGGTRIPIKHYDKHWVASVPTKMTTIHSAILT